MTEAFGAIGMAFEREHPGVRVVFNFAGSQILATQLDQGARADVFASADQRWADFLRDKGLLTGDPQTFARNRLVVVLPRSNPGLVARLQDLGRPGLKLVLAGPQVPVGNYSRTALRLLNHAPGFPADFDRRVLSNVVSEEENVRAVVAKVQLREADAGIAYRTDVTGPVLSQLKILEIPEAYNPSAEYPIAAVKGGQSELAASFMRLVVSPQGQAMLGQRGFIPIGQP